MACAGGRQAIVLALRGEIIGATARGLRAFGQDLVGGGVSAVIVDCTATPGLNGHLLGALQDLARTASRHRVPVGVCIDAAGEEAIRRDIPSVSTAASSARLLDVLGVKQRAAVIELVTRPCREHVAWA